MKRRIWFGAFFLAAVGGLTCAPYTLAVDLDSFEFNDASGTLLAGGANTANPANNWVEGTGMGASDIRNGSYNIVKQQTTLVSNYLQIDNITSGTRYLVARMSGWDFYFNPGDPSEEFRIAFLDNDTGNSGATITAQMNIRRDAGGSGNIVLMGSALGSPGTSATDIPGAPILNTTQTNPFTMVLELNKDTNSYKIFYKDGANPTQVLGLGTVDSARGGNSARMAVNGNFGNFSDDYPIDYFEVFSVDRLALTDTNPFSDLISLEIDRGSASMTLRNTSGATISGIESYSITSVSGGLNPAGWNPGAATPTTSTNEALAATFTTPISLTNAQTLSLSMGVGAWIKSPFEDLQMVLNLTGGATRTVNVNFLANGGMKWQHGDFNLNNTIDAGDWLSFIANAESDLDGLSRVEGYQSGDLDGDGVNSIKDFVAFKALYDAANGGAGAFDAMIVNLSVPEPSSMVLLGTAALFLSARRRRRGRIAPPVVHTIPSQASQDHSPAGDSAMPPFAKIFLTSIVAVMMAAAVPTARAIDLVDFPFNDDDDALLNEAANVVNPANTWIVESNMTNSSVQSGVYHVRKDTSNLARNVLDITSNIASGKGWIVAEIDGWRFNSEQSVGNFEPTALEQFRLTFLDNDAGLTVASSFVTAEARIQRTSGGGLELFGTALGTGGTNVSGVQPALNLNQIEPFTFVLELDKNANQYSIFYKTASASSFSLFGTANVASDREGNSMRLAFSGDYSGIDMISKQEFFDLDRIYATTTNPLDLPIDPTTLTLEVKSNGQVSIRNDTNGAINFNSYRIGFEDDLTEDLNFAGWNSLSDQGIDAVGGGNDPGETWDEAGGSSYKVLAESFLLGSSTITPDNSLSLGSAFQPGGAHNLLKFEYHDINLASVITGEVEFVVVQGVDGDYNDDDVVNAADYVIWRKNVGTTNTMPNDPHGGTIGSQQYNTWRANFGMTGGSGSGLAGSSVPEPAALWLAGLATLALAARRRARRDIAS
ncbi:MAG: PEP-CTERM sorting domain-containing protein [Pirellulales bacterium]